jgi:hypothetical protein
MPLHARRTHPPHSSYLYTRAHGPRWNANQAAKAAGWQLTGFIPEMESSTAAVQVHVVELMRWGGRCSWGMHAGRQRGPGSRFSGKPTLQGYQYPRTHNIPALLVFTSSQCTSSHILAVCQYPRLTMYQPRTNNQSTVTFSRWASIHVLTMRHLSVLTICQQSHSHGEPVSMYSQCNNPKICQRSHSHGAPVSTYSRYTSIHARSQICQQSHARSEPESPR